jgi:hypothetical protein
VFLLSSDRICGIISTRFLSSAQLFVSSSNIKFVPFLIMVLHSLSFCLKELILLVLVRVFSFFHCMLWLIDPLLSGDSVNSGRC